MDDTILEVAVLREMDDETTAPHRTEPGVLACLAAGEPPPNEPWVAGFHAGCAAMQADIRRALVASEMKRGAMRGAAEAYAMEVVKLAAGG